MDQETFKNELISRIVSYINDKNIDSNAIASSYADLIIRYVHTNPENILKALDQAIALRASNFEELKRAGMRYLSIPIADSDLQVRCYFQENFPSLKFRVNGEKNSFLGLKRERNGSNIIVSAAYDDKRKEKSLPDYEINKEVFIFNQDGTLVKKNFQKITPSVPKSQRVDISKIIPENEEEAKQLDLLNLVYYCMVKNHVKTSINLPIESLDVLFSDFFRQAESIVCMEDELNFYEVLRAAGQLIYFKNDLGQASARIQDRGEDYSLFETNSGRKTPLRQNIGEHIPVKINGSGNDNNFYDTVICDEEGKPKYKYMFMQTTDGFSVARICQGKLDDPSKKILTIAISHNQLRIACNANMSYSPALIELNFGENGNVDYEFSEIKTTGNINLEKRGNEELRRILFEQHDGPIKF